MRVSIFVFLLFFSSNFLRAQRTNFVYIQSEPARLFSVIIKGDTITSSKAGYLILSKLTDTAYQVGINFPGQNWPVQYFTLNVFQSDRGYLLKDYGDKGWGLLDWKSLLVQYGKRNILSENTLPINPTVSEDFADLLAKAAGDPSLRARDENKQTTIVPTQAAPVPPIENVIEPAKQPQKEKKDTVISWSDSPVITNPRCTMVATQQQMNELLIKLDSLTVDMKRVLLISKALQNFCLSVSQVAAVAEKFTTDEGRYDFFLEAWLYVTDRSQFDRLYQFFKNPAFAVRLKEMLQ